MKLQLPPTEHASILKLREEELYESVDKLFQDSGITMPLRLLADFFSDFVGRISIEEESDADYLSREDVATTVYRGTQLMASLAELYDRYTEVRLLKQEC